MHQYKVKFVSSLLVFCAGIGGVKAEEGEFLESIAPENRAIASPMTCGGKNPITPGCSACVPSCAYSTGGYQTCTTCDGTRTTRNCTPPLPTMCGSDGAPLSIQNDEKGRPAIITAVGKDRVTRTLSYYYPNYLTLTRADGGMMNCIPDNECATIDSAGNCYPSQGSGLGGMYGVINRYAMSFCARYAPNFSARSAVQYSDSTGSQVLVQTEVNNYSGLVRTIITTPTQWAQISTIGSTSIASSSFAAPVTLNVNFNAQTNPDSPMAQAIATYMPELSKISYFHRFHQAQLMDFNYQFPNYTIPGWWRYYGDAVIGIGSYGVAQLLGAGVVLVGGVALGPEVAAMWLVLTAVGYDVWQNEPALRDAAYYYINVLPWCAAAQAGDELMSTNPPPGGSAGLYTPSVPTLMQLFCPAGH